MEEVGVDISGQESKTLDRYLHEPFDHVITVCDDANEACPFFPGAQSRLHWSFEDPSRAVAELSRVVKPMGVVVLLEPTWSSDLTSGVREMLVERLGLRPRMLVEWKQMLRDAGIVELQVQDWTSGGPTRQTGAPKTVDENTLTWQQKVQIVGRAWRRWGWREARTAVERETTLLRELSRERTIGFQLLKGVKWPHATTRKG